MSCMSLFTVCDYCHHSLHTYHTPSEKMAPHDLSSPSSPALDPEEIRQRKMAKRAKVIDELVKTENDFLTDLELCIKEVLQPLREAQVQEP